MATQAYTTSREILYIPIEKITANPYQPRKLFDRKAMEDLSKNIRQYGVIQPISVRLMGNSRFELIAGERRLRAAKLAGLQTIPSIILNINDKDSAVIALIENIQRRDLNYIEEAEGFLILMKDYGFTQEMVAEKMNKSQSAIANKIRLLKLPIKIRTILIEEGLSERHARALLRLEDENSQYEVLDKIIKLDLTVAKTEALIESMISCEEKKKSKKTVKYKIKDFRIFENSIKQTVEMFKRSGFETCYDVEETADGIEFLVKVKSK